MQSNYVSEFSNFMDGYLRRHPEVHEDQQRGWYIWWDHDPRVIEEEWGHAEEVKPKAYQYD